MGKHENGFARSERDFYPTPTWVTEALAYLKRRTASLTRQRPGHR